MSPKLAMRTGSPPADIEEVSAPGADAVPGSWEQLRSESAIQFAPVDIPPRPPREPGLFERFLEWLSDLVAPVLGPAIVAAWPIIKIVLIVALIAGLLVLVWQVIEPLLRIQRAGAANAPAGEWMPEEAASLALLEDADRLAAAGRFDEATHLLLTRSIGQIAEARPGWVEPSSTARELASLDALPAAARRAFGIIAERVERSLFALSPLARHDWEEARAAYSDFALAPLSGQTP